MYFEIYKSAHNHQYWFVIKSLGNNKVLATSEMYERKESAIHTVQLIGSSSDARYYDQTGES
ncbi:MAG: hypothetical protein JWN82_82 [Candidatus Saccharibacteria bacterium]|nr:hypothetical protein [Candidatus Saccharibacteria bacterium]